MHILLVPSWYPTRPGDPAGSFFRDQAVGLATRGHRVGVIAPTLLSLRQVRELRTALTPFEVDEGVPTYRGRVVNVAPRVPYVGPEIHLTEGSRLFRRYVAAHGRPDVLHAHSLLNGGLLAARLGREFDIPFVVTEHATGFARGTFRGWQLKWAAVAAARASRRIAVSEPLARLLTGQLGGVWDYVGNIVSNEFAASPLTEAPSGPFTVCNASFLTPKKGLDVLLEAFARAFGPGDDARLRIAGDGEQAAALHAQARLLGIADRVEFLGRLRHDRVIELMRESHCYALSSHVETFGVVLVESLALGRPVVATRCGGPESIVTERDGYLVDPGSVDQLADALVRLRDDVAASRFTPAELRDHCLARFGTDAVLSQLDEVYSTLPGR